MGSCYRRKGNTMDNTTELIISVDAPDYKIVEVTTSTGRRYRADLSAFSNVYCFPKNKNEWAKVSIDSYGLALVWASRFEVHADQIVNLGVELQPNENNKQSLRI
jgi:hypothetical protein